MRLSHLEMRVHNSPVTDGLCILNSGPAAWAFERLAAELSKVFGVTVSEKPMRRNYVLAFPELENVPSSFIPIHALEIAGDKRKIAEAFNRGAVPTPKSVLLDSPAAVS